MDLLMTEGWITFSTSQMWRGSKFLEAGDIVSFDTQQDKKGPRAVKIQLIKRGDDI